MIEFTVPVPPSVNALYANRAGHGRVLTTEARNWKKDNAWLIASQRPQAFRPFQHEVSVEITVERGTRSRDLDNMLKILLDTIKEAGLYRDDSQVAELRIAWGPVKDCRVRMEARAA